MLSKPALDEIRALTQIIKPGREGLSCLPRKDFIRQIANRVLAESAGKISISILGDLKERLVRGEDKYGFSAYGGDPARIIEYLESDDWASLVDYARNLHVEWVLEKLMLELAREYSEDCSEVAKIALKRAEEIRAKGPLQEALSIEKAERLLKLHGYNVQVQGNKLEFEEPFIKVRLELTGVGINYQICKAGKASSINAVLSKLEKIREM